ncbi:hypothetical protein M426DRAFT_256793 [Hypoxylon sp. CI-4A]|nr:hypothetical protein M426DRAFT_256793 [Hypoxylon sp. CI-4A]
MADTIILTGAKGTVGIPAAKRLLEKHPQFTVIFTVRNDSQDDANTQNLRKAISRHPNAKAAIYKVYLANLSVVHEFTNKVSAAIAAGDYPPLRSIICCAAYWDLAMDSETTVDGYDKSMAVNHISHVVLVLRLVGSFAPEGRVVLFSSIAHYLYASSKLMITTWIYPFNRYLQQDPKLKNITVVAINPGGLGFIMKPLMTAIHYLVDPTFRSSAEAASDVVELAVNNTHPGERGYFTLLKKDASDSITMNERVQQRVWKKSLEWARITKDNTKLKEAV